MTTYIGIWSVPNFTQNAVFPCYLQSGVITYSTTEFNLSLFFLWSRPLITWQCSPCCTYKFRSHPCDVIRIIYDWSLIFPYIIHISSSKFSSDWGLPEPFLERRAPYNLAFGACSDYFPSVPLSHVANRKPNI